MAMTDKPVPSSEHEGGPLARGEPGRSAEAEYQRRSARDAQRRRERFGPFSWLAEAFGGERQSTRAWSTGASGERRVAAELDRALGDRGVLLHDRRMPRSRGNIDHVAVAPSGVWVIDAKGYRGRVERRNVGGWFRTDVRLRVGRHDRSEAVEGVRHQEEAVRRVLESDFGADAPPLRAAICLVGAEWPFFARPFSIAGVWVTWPRRLGKMLLGPAVLDRRQVEDVARALARRFPVR